MKILISKYEVGEAGALPTEVTERDVGENARRQQSRVLTQRMETACRNARAGELEPSIRHFFPRTWERIISWLNMPRRWVRNPCRPLSCSLPPLSGSSGP